MISKSRTNISVLYGIYLLVGLYKCTFNNLRAQVNSALASTL